MDKSYSYEKLRIFHPTSTLHRYLANRRPGSIPLEIRKYSMCSIILSLMEIIEDDRLFDPDNPMVVICDSFLEKALNVKAFHITDLRRIIAIQLQRIPEKNKPYFLHDGCEIPIRDFDENINTHALPSWGSQAATAVLARKTMTKTFNTFAWYELSKELREVLEKPCDISKNIRYLPYGEIVNMFSYYIQQNKYKLFDPRNPLVAIVKDDPIGKALGVKAFHQKQALCLLRNQLTIKTRNGHNENYTNNRQNYNRNNKHNMNNNARYRNNRY